MDTKILIEAFGYLGSGLVVVSMLMNSVVKLRVVNTIGSVIFAIYALIIKSYPTAVMNVCLVSINIYHLMKLRNTQKYYKVFETQPGDGFLNYLLSYYKEDIVKYFPNFSVESLKDSPAARIFTVCCEDKAAGAIGGEQHGDELEFLLDYSTPAYRDTSEGAFLYSELKKFGIRSLVSRGDSAEHAEYLKKMGFTGPEEGVYRKML